MSDDFHKGTLNDSNVSNFSEAYRGQAYQRDANLINTGSTHPHGTGGMWYGSGGMVITGESPILQSIVSIPFLILGLALYPVAAASTVIAGLLCVRLQPLLGSGATWQRYLAFIPMLLVFWFGMRWDVRFGARNVTYRRVRHGARLLVFALLGYLLVDIVAPANKSHIATLPHLGGATVGTALGHWFLMRGEGWRNFWHQTLAKFRILS